MSFIQVKNQRYSSGETILIAVEEIAYVISDGGKTEISLRNGRDIPTTESFDEVKRKIAEVKS